MRCNNCKVDIGNSNICPLCHEIINKDNVTEIKCEYPPKREKRPLPLIISPRNIYLIIAVFIS